MKELDKSKEEFIFDAHLKILNRIGEEDEKYRSILHIITNFMNQSINSLKINFEWKFEVMNQSMQNMKLREHNYQSEVESLKS